MILTNDQIQDFGFNMLPLISVGAFTDFARAIEAAVIDKLTAGVEMPKPLFNSWHGNDFKSLTNPDGVCNAFPAPLIENANDAKYWEDKGYHSEPLYTADQLQTAIAASRVKALEDAEDAIETANARRVLYVPDCLDVIRALKGGV